MTRTKRKVIPENLKEKNETQYLKAREVAGYVDYRNHLLFLEECDIDFEIGK